MRRYRFPMLAVLALALLITPASAQDRLDRGPKVATAISHLITATDQHGVARDFSSLVGKRGLILLFTRSLDW